MLRADAVRPPLVPVPIAELPRLTALTRATYVLVALLIGILVATALR